MKCLLVCRGGGLFPDDEDTAAVLEKLPKEGGVLAEIKKPRNPYFLRKYFKLIRTAWQFLNERQVAECGGSAETFRRFVQMQAGYCDLVTDPESGQTLKLPKSIAFHNMDETEFSELYDRVTAYLFQHILTNLTPEEYEEHFLGF